MILDTVDSTSLFSAGLTSTARSEWVQGRAMEQAIDLFTGKRYESAIKAMTRAIGYSPNSANAVKGYQIIAQAYSKLNDSEGAIKAYQQALRLDPGNASVHNALGNIQYFLKNYPEALKAYQAAAELDPSDANHYSLGQGYLANGQYPEAESEFRLVNSMTPNKPQGYYGLGLVYAKRGQPEEAIGFFRKALAIQGDYQEAYSELGFALAAAGRLDEAEQVREGLSADSSELALQLNQYIHSRTAPRMTLANSADFNGALGPGTSVSGLGSYLSAPNAAQTFSIQFYFDKAMDAGSVQNVFNWTIGRSTQYGAGKAYNFGMQVADTEVMLDPHPVSVYYDANSQSATVFFNIPQNAAGDGTLDPSHIQFAFSGKDMDGLTMDGKADQYLGFSGFA